MENFIETIKLKDGKVYQLEYHQQRVNQTFKYFFKQSAVLQLNTEINKIILQYELNIMLIIAKQKFPLILFVVFQVLNLFIQRKITRLNL